MSMITKDYSLVVAQSFCDRSAFILFEGNTTMLEADRMVIVKAGKSKVLIFVPEQKTYRQAS